MSKEKESEQLVEIKKGQTGTGLIIDNDGFMSLDYEKNKQLKESIMSDEDDEGWHVPYPFKLKTVFQKFGIVNANGRIYPEDVLKREVEKYQQKIRERRSYGECYTPDTLIMTENGWKQLSEVKEGENILTLNTDTDEIEMKPIKKVISYHYLGDMIRIKGKNINDLVTPNHKYPIYDRNHKFKSFVTAEEIYNSENMEGNYIPCCEKICGNDFISKMKLSQKGILLSKGFNDATKEKYNGEVMCVEVENHTWYCMCNDKSHWTGNCNHPAEATIDLGRIAFLITELHWEGHTLVGEIEIPVSYGFRKMGIISSLADLIGQWIMSGLKVGVSSRGVGSVKNVMGQQVVDDDYEIECWDAVSDPSTPGAWIVPNGNTDVYVERNETNDNRPKINEKIKKALEILK
jgi:hypothetical protein